MKNPALAFISSTICLVRLIIVIACLGFVPSAHADETRWSADVCGTLRFEEWLVTDVNKPLETIYGRAPLLRMLKDHCGIDVRRKQKADAEYLDWLKKADRQQRRASAPPSDYVPPPPHWSQPDPAPEPRTVVVPVPVETLPRGPCTIRNLGGDGQLSTMSCP